MTYRHNTGFTLIELLIVIAIIGILAALAYPSYQDSVRKARRTDGTSMLLQLANRMERCFTKDGSYTGASCPGDQLSDEGYYQITVAATATTYDLTATAQALGGQDQDKASCLVMTVDETGAKTPDPDDDRCWAN